MVERLTQAGAETIRVLDNDESGVFGVKQQFADRETEIQPVLGDLRDERRVQTATEGVDEVFHVGAVKHVPVSEYNPFETIRTNLSGTRNVLRAAGEAGVNRVTAVSTDKASHPASVMGATKLLMERMVVAANGYWTPCDTRYNCVRFGNVLGSTDSVVPIFLEQIRDGGPLTVTDPEMTRFVMAPDEAVSFVLDTHRRATRGEVVVSKMPAFRVGQLAHTLRDRYAPTCGYEPSDIEIEQIGPRPGERYHEKLVSSDERVRTHETDDAFLILPDVRVGDEDRDYEPQTSLEGEYTSVDAELLDDDELWALVTDEFSVESAATGHRLAADGGS